MLKDKYGWYMLYIFGWSTPAICRLSTEILNIRISETLLHVHDLKPEVTPRVGTSFADKIKNEKENNAGVGMWRFLLI